MARATPPGEGRDVERPGAPSGLGGGDRPAGARRQTAPLGAAELAKSVGRRVEEIMASADEAAAALRRQAELATEDLIAEARSALEEDTDAIRREVERRAAQYLAECRRRVDAYAEARIQRIGDLSAHLIDQGAVLAAQLDSAIVARRHLEDLADDLARAAQQLAAEMNEPPVVLPSIDDFRESAPPGPAAGRVEHPPGGRRRAGPPGSRTWGEGRQ